jgi:putative transposase
MGHLITNALAVTLPKPMTSHSKAEGRFGKQDFRYLVAEDVYICPALRPQATAPNSRLYRLRQEQIIGILRGREIGAATAGICRKHGISSTTFYKWKAKNGGLEVSDADRLKALEEENAKLEKLLAEAMLDNAMLKDVAAKFSAIKALIDSALGTT